MVGSANSRPPCNAYCASRSCTVGKTELGPPILGIEVALPAGLGVPGSPAGLGVPGSPAGLDVTGSSTGAGLDTTGATGDGDGIAGTVGATGASGLGVAGGGIIDVGVKVTIPGEDVWADGAAGATGLGVTGTGMSNVGVRVSIPGGLVGATGGIVGVEATGEDDTGGNVATGATGFGVLPGAIG